MYEVGQKNEVSEIVEEKHLASSMRDGLARVLATPYVAELVEESGRAMIDPHLPEGRQTVGLSINLRHTAPTPPGMKVTAIAELVEIDGRRLAFKVEVFDDEEKIAEAEHERFIIDSDRFYKRVDEKAGRVKDVKI